MYSNTQGAVKVNGYLTKAFSIERGVRQGCPLSALLYVLCAEVLAIEIRGNNAIKGYKYSMSKEHKISQYADDNSVVITTIESHFELFKVMDRYEKATNARLNKKKTEGLWTGSWKNREDKPLMIKWTSDQVKCTGVYIGNNRENCSLLGFSEIFSKIKTKLTYWKGKFLSLKGKVKVLNVFVLAKLWFCLECQDLSKKLCKDLERMLADFIWKDVHQREMEVLYTKLDCGGLNLQDPSTKQKALRVKWLSEVLHGDSNSIKYFLASSLIGKHDNIKGCKLAVSSNHYDNLIKNDFYKNVIKSWRVLRITFNPGSIQSIRRDSVYYNILLADENGNVFKRPNYIPPYAPEYICDLPITIHPREIRGTFKLLIPKINLAFLKIAYSESGKDEFHFKIKEDEYKSLKNISFGDLYDFFLREKRKPSRVWEEKWKNDSELELTTEQWSLVWANVHHKSLNYKVQSSIWETIHRNFMCQYFAKIAYKDSGMCKLCKQEQLTRTHIFMNCDVILGCYSSFLHITDNIFKLGPVNLIERAFGLQVEGEDKDRVTLRNFINFSVRHVVYRSRNTTCGSNIPNSVLTLCKKIEIYIHNDLNEKFISFKATNRVDEYKKMYLIDDVLGCIDRNNELVCKNLV